MEVHEFFNPKSMLTPGIAGCMIMLITNALWVQFMLPPKWVALVLSFFFVLSIIVKFRASFFEKIFYFIFNGLIIFSLAVGTNIAGLKITETPPSSLISARGFQIEPEKPQSLFFTPWF